MTDFSGTVDESDTTVSAGGYTAKFFGPEGRKSEEILQKTGVQEDEVAYLGDDLPDLTVMRRVGLAVAVGDAADEVKSAAHYTTVRNGGKGAARELIELILKSKGIWEEMIEKARA